MLLASVPAGRRYEAQPSPVPIPTCRDGETAGAHSEPREAAGSRVRHCAVLRIASRRPPAPNALPRRASAYGFFYSHRSLDRPRVDIEIESLPDLRRQLAGSNRLARY